ncbi:heat shock protein beta-2-like, partial [Hypanus sabinus]
LSPEDVLAPTLYHGYYIRPRINKQLDRGFSEIATSDHKFQVLLDVCQFLPDELSVRTVDNLLEVAGSHPQKLDGHGFVSRQFRRTYVLPLDVDPLLVRASLSHDGVLCLEAPREGGAAQPRVRSVEIGLPPTEGGPGAGIREGEPALGARRDH